METTPIAPEEGTTLPESSANDGHQADERPGLQSVPLHKHMEVKKSLEQKLGETEAQYTARIQQLEQDLARYRQLSVDDDVRAFAEESGLDLPVVQKLLEMSEKRAEKKLAPLQELQEKMKKQEMEAYKQQVEAEFSQSVAPLIINEIPNASPTVIAGIRAKIMELANQAPYNTYRLADIYRVHKDALVPKNRYTAEQSGGMATTTGDDFSNVTTEDVRNMDWKTAERYTNWLKKQQR